MAIGARSRALPLLRIDAPGSRTGEAAPTPASGLRRPTGRSRPVVLLSILLGVGLAGALLVPREAPPHPGGVLVSAFRQPEAVPSVTSLARGAELDSEDANARTNSAGASAGARGAALGTWVVAPGETLWSIARVVAPDQDPREVVEALRRVNDLRSATLRVGQTLRIPPEVARR